MLLFDNEVGQRFYQLDHMTFSKNVFWSANFALSFCQIYYSQMSTLWLTYMLKFLLRRCTHCKKLQAELFFILCNWVWNTPWWYLVVLDSTRMLYQYAIPVYRHAKKILNRSLLNFAMAVTLMGLRQSYGSLKRGQLLFVRNIIF